MPDEQVQTEEGQEQEPDTSIEDELDAAVAEAEQIQAQQEQEPEPESDGTEQQEEQPEQEPEEKQEPDPLADAPDEDPLIAYRRAQREAELSARQTQQYTPEQLAQFWSQQQQAQQQTTQYTEEDDETPVTKADMRRMQNAMQHQLNQQVAHVQHRAAQEIQRASTEQQINGMIDSFLDRFPETGKDRTVMRKAVRNEIIERLSQMKWDTPDIERHGKFIIKQLRTQSGTTNPITKAQQRKQKKETAGVSGMKTAGTSQISTTDEEEDVDLLNPAYTDRAWYNAGRSK
jgi:hypothetical protein